MIQYLLRGLLGLSVGFASTVQAALSTTGWIQADDVLVRQEPFQTSPVLGVLQRGVELKFDERPEDQILHNYCEVDVAGYSGHVACRFISKERKTPRQAGVGDTEASMRWINAKGVNLRERPAQDSPAVGRLNFNNSLRLKQKIEGSAYCEVELPNKKTGFTACIYLSDKPTMLASWNAGVLSASANLESVSKAFWAKPDWSHMKDYAKLLERKLPPEQRRTGPWPRNDELEKMKVRLTQGVLGVKDKPFEDWEQIQADAAKAMIDLQKSLRAAGGKKADQMSEDWKHFVDVAKIAGQIGLVMRFYGGAFQPDDFSWRQKMSPLYLARAIQLPSVQPSYFKSDSEIGVPSSQPEQLAAKFNVLSVQRVQNRYAMPKNEEAVNIGIYGLFSLKQSLNKDIIKNYLFRDASTSSLNTRAEQIESIVPDYIDESGCGFDGFSFGDSDRSIWLQTTQTYKNKKESDQAWAESRKRNPANSLFAFYAAQGLPNAQSQMTQTQQALNRAETGFIRATQFAYDIDHDGVSDIIVWEGQGKGPGHLGGPSETDDRWYRIAFVNIAGRWKILGVDTFSYGCGC